MDDILDEDFVPVPPTPERVAARALVLATVSCRALIEEDKGKPEAEDLRKRLLPWLESIGIAYELEPEEQVLISTPLGVLHQEKVIDASWKSEAMTVLAWVLGCVEFPPISAQCDDPADIANAMGFLGAREDTPLQTLRLRDAVEIDLFRDTYLTLHWRLRQFSLDHASLDFVAYVTNFVYGDLKLDLLEIVDNDLAIDGIRIDKLDHARYREVLSITQERHQALNWLLGFEEVYSRVTTDT